MFHTHHIILLAGEAIIADTRTVEKSQSQNLENALAQVMFHTYSSCLIVAKTVINSAHSVEKLKHTLVQVMFHPHHKNLFIAKVSIPSHFVGLENESTNSWRWPSLHPSHSMASHPDSTASSYRPHLNNQYESWYHNLHATVLDLSLPPPPFPF